MRINSVYEPLELIKNYKRLKGDIEDQDNEEQARIYMIKGKR